MQNYTPTPSSFGSMSSNLRNLYSTGRKVYKVVKDFRGRNDWKKAPVKRRQLYRPLGGGMRVATQSAGASNTIISRSIKRKSAPNVKVSKKLKAKIRKVITGDAIKGKTQEVSYGVLRWTDSEDFKQQIVDITSYNNLITYEEPMFSNLKILDAASVLWNEKAQTANKQLVTGNFDNQKLKVKIISSSVEYIFRNNTQRELSMSLLEISPASAQVQGSPFISWPLMLSRAAGTAGPNQNNILITEMHTHPAMLPEFRKLFNTKTAKVTIPPGGTHVHTVQGPTDKMCDFTKYWNGSSFQNYQSHCVWLFAIYYPDLITTDLGGFGRIINSAGATPDYGIVYEAIDRYVLELPEQTGFIAPNPATPGSVQPLSQRSWSFAYKTYPYVGEVGSAVRIDDENPAVKEANPL